LPGLDESAMRLTSVQSAHDYHLVNQRVGRFMRMWDRGAAISTTRSIGELIDHFSADE
jgi:hypothetical protein